MPSQRRRLPRRPSHPPSIGRELRPPARRRSAHPPRSRRRRPRGRARCRAMARAGASARPRPAWRRRPPSTPRPLPPTPSATARPPAWRLSATAAVCPARRVSPSPPACPPRRPSRPASRRSTACCCARAPPRSSRPPARPMSRSCKRPSPRSSGCRPSARRAPTIWGCSPRAATRPRQRPPRAGARPTWAGTTPAGWAQRQDWPALARFYADEPGAAAMLFRHADLNAWAGAWLLVGLLGADVPALAADVLRHCPAVASLAARATLLDAADALLHGDRPAEASAILDVLAGLPPLAGAVAMASAGPPPSETREAAPERPPVADALDMADRRDGADARQAASYAARLRRAQAECLQAQGLFGAARARLEAALAQAAGAERAGLLGALGLVAGEFAQLAELRLPEAEMDPAPWRRRLVAGAPYFREALAAALDSAPLVGEPAPSSSGGATATAQVGLGALEWLSERPAAARPHFE